MVKICVIGTGHVGLVTGACLAEMGNHVICVDDDSAKIEGLQNNLVPFYEPGLDVMVRQNVTAGRLVFLHKLEDGIADAEIVFIAVGTPQKPGGQADLASIENVARRIASVAEGYKPIVEKSTVPIKTWEWINKTILKNCRQSLDFELACNPEFLREGSAINDFMHPDRIVIGVNSERAKKQLSDLYKRLDSPVLTTDVATAELIKHASNSFLALKISYINAVAAICEKTGADVMEVAEGMGLDRRIGRSFLNAGIGYGGHCFPKDVSAFIKMAEEVSYDFELLKAVQKINDSQRNHVIQKAQDLLQNLKSKTIGVLGLSYKPDTNDMREAPSVYIIGELVKHGVHVKAYDPQAMKGAAGLLPPIEFCNDPYKVAKGADALMILTEWDEFKSLDLSRIRQLLKQPILIDGRNVYDPATMKKLGFIYSGIGR